MSANRVSQIIYYVGVGDKGGAANYKWGRLALENGGGNVVLKEIFGGRIRELDSLRMTEIWFDPLLNLAQASLERLYGCDCLGQKHISCFSTIP
jgi:hypothetical protein